MSYVGGSLILSRKATPIWVSDQCAIGSSAMANTAQFRVSIKFVNDMVILKRTTGSLAAKKQGNGGGHGKLSGVASWTLRRIREKRDLTLDELVVDLREVQGIEAHRVPVWRHLRGLGLTHKKRPAGRPAEPARRRTGLPDMDRPPPALHAQHADKIGIH